MFAHLRSDEDIIHVEYVGKVFPSGDYYGDVTLPSSKGLKTLKLAHSSNNVEKLSFHSRKHLNVLPLNMAHSLSFPKDSSTSSPNPS